MENNKKWSDWKVKNTIKNTTTCKWIMNLANNMLHDLVQNGNAVAGTFVARRGWLQKFVDGNHFTIRRRTTILQILSIGFIVKLTDFEIYLRQNFLSRKDAHYCNVSSKSRCIQMQIVCYI